jgi:hypothetical protein
MIPTDIKYITLKPWDRPTAGTTVSMASNTALQTLTPRLGPTSVLFLHRFARRGALVEVTTYDQLASELGIAPGVMAKTVQRIVRFGFARWVDTDQSTLEIATELGAGPPPSDGGTPAQAQTPHLRAA